MSGGGDGVFCILPKVPRIVMIFLGTTGKKKTPHLCRK